MCDCLFLACFMRQETTGNEGVAPLSLTFYLSVFVNMEAGDLLFHS